MTATVMPFAEQQALKVDAQVQERSVSRARLETALTDLRRQLAQHEADLYATRGAIQFAEWLLATD